MSEFQAFNPVTHPIIKLLDDWNTLLDHGLVKAASYIMRKNGIIYEIIDGSTGKIFLSGADVATILQPCINTLISPNGGIIYVTGGIYPITAPVTLKNGLTLIGDGIGQTVFQGAAGIAAVFNTPTDWVGRIVLRDFEIDGQDDTNGPDTGMTLAIYQSSLERIYIHECVDHGIRLIGATGNDGNSNMLNEIYLADIGPASGGGIGLEVEAANYDNTFIHIQAAGCTYGIKIDTSPSNIFTNTKCFANDYCGIWVVGMGATGTMFNLFDADHNGQHGIKLESVYQLWFCNGRIFDNSQSVPGSYSGIYIDGAWTTGPLYIDKIIFYNADHRHHIQITNAILAGSIIYILNNDFSAAGTSVIDNLGAGLLVCRANSGYTTSNKNTATIVSGSTSIVVNHGCAYTPTAADINITPTLTTTNDPGMIWVDTIGAATFKVNCLRDPGASGLTFEWMVWRTP